MNKSDNSLNKDLPTINKKMNIFFEQKIKDTILFSSFFSNLKIDSFSDDEIYLVTDNELTQQMLENDYMDVVKESIKSLFNKNMSIKILTKNQKKEQKNAIKSEKNIDTKKAFKSNLVSKFNFDNWIQGSFNKDVLRASKSILNGEEIEFNPIFIHSNSGMGKTHFLHALGNELKKQNKIVYYLNPDFFTNEIAMNLKEKDVEQVNNLISFLNSVDVLLIDDIQMLANRNKTLGILFNVINTLNQKNKQIIICADKKPEELGGFEERFITRFQGGLVLEIKSPTNDDLLKILKFKIQQQKLNIETWESEAFNFIVRNFYKSIRELEGAINKIKFFSSGSQKNIKFTEIVVNNIFRDASFSKSEITSDRIVNCVANYYKIKVNEIVGKSRKKEIVVARNMCVLMLRDMLSYSYEKIGMILGGKNHSTILASYKKVENEKKVAPDIKNAIINIKNKIQKAT
ncbi:chromosomal replication initiator protein DnaA [Mesomycoplasma lagogenitalium]|uniref:Chromosomal replication initiator protein DnaA n=1 Tax=Mesomycoplasma lagogenitalium TaxID=171286 RepID=A0ABY8LTU5_9BACT|nr:chromosomal replication initiator protein DnaA [Mesomycoplasma lagogenitalium]WGI36659.1 chromosomal replication initiator protein DnaA [Mesomycoplasma lagogenitalium]